MAQHRMEAMLERLAKRYPVLDLDHTDTLLARQDSESSAMAATQTAGEPCDHSNTDSQNLWLTLRQCLEQAQREGAQSLHLEPEGDQLRVRQRLISGLEERRISLQSELGRAIPLLASRIRGEQDNTRAACGFIHLSNNKAALIAETLLIPCVQGETVHFHLCPDPDARPGLDELGMDANQSRECRDLLSQASGLIVVSCYDKLQRARTLRAMAQELISPERRVLSIEPKIHPVLPGCLQFPINQNPWNEDSGDDALIDVCNIDAGSWMKHWMLLWWFREHRQAIPLEYCPDCLHGEQLRHIWHKALAQSLPNNRLEASVSIVAALFTQI